MKQKNYKMLIRNSTQHEKSRIFQRQYQRQVEIYITLFLFDDGFLLEFVFTYKVFLWCSEKKTPNNKYLLVVIKRISKVQEKNMSYERALNFDQWKTCSTNNKPITVSCFQIFFKFIQTQKRFPNSLHKYVS